MEKRSWPRKASRFAASLQIAVHHYPCIIRDFSQTGVLARLDEPMPEALRKQLAQQTTGASLQLHLPGKSLTLSVELARVTDQGAGLRLLNPTSEHYYALQQAAKIAERQAHPLEHRPNAPQPRLDPAVQSRLARDASMLYRTFLESELPVYFAQLEAILVAETDRQNHQGAQQPFFDAVALLRQQQARIVTAVTSRIQQAILDIAKSTRETIIREPAASSTLELVSKGDFEDWLVVRVAVSRADALLRQPLIALQLRVDAAFAKTTGTRLFNPFSPAALCNTLFEALRPLGLKNAVLEVIFQALQNTLMDRLQTVYNDLNQLFASAAVLPDLDITRYTEAQAATQDRTSAPVQPAQMQSDSAHAADTPFAPAPSSLDTEATFASTAVSQLRLLHQHRVDRSPAQETGSEGIGSHGGDDWAVEMIEGLFQSINQNDQVADDLQSDIHGLQRPLLRILLTDPELFNEPDHPARQAMNHLALLADRDSINLAANRAAIRQNIHHVLTSQDEVAGFAEVLPKLEALALREQRIIERNRRRLREQCAGQQRLVQATRHVERELTRILRQPVPQVVIDVVEQGWRELMRLTCLRQGSVSPEFAETSDILQHVLRHLQPERSAHPPTRSVQTLLELLNAGLAQVSQDSRAREELLAAIRKLLHTGATTDTPLAHYTGAEFDSDILERRLAEQADTDTRLLRWLKRARSLEPEQWFEFRIDAQAPQQLQLLWVADDFSQFMFVNRQATRQLGLALDEVAQRMRDSSLVPMHAAALPAVDRGLDALIEKMYDTLAFDSTHDQLTGLLTRKEFSRCLDRCVARASEAALSYTLIFIDIQQFKVINNTCGYDAGDRFLRELAERLRQVAVQGATAGEALSETASMIGRVGADQFALLLPLPAEGPGYRLAVELKSAIETNRFIENGKSFVIHAAIAMLGFDQRNHKVMELLRSVETASELSKRAGAKDIQIVLPGDGRLVELDEVMTWVTRINRALDDDNLKLRCQMIAPLAGDGQLLPHFEVLLTVIDDLGEHMPPAGFIKAAEAYNRMGSVDRWVIETVLRWMHEHPEQLHRSGGFSINLSGHSMNDETFLDFIFDALVRYQVPRDKLIFEITESTAVANLEDAADFITEMRSIGCRFSLDDFGVGQSSYSYLKRLPVDFIKIDGSFIKDISSSDVDFALVRSITEMGHYLHKQVIAEHVANADILATVAAIGVDYAQGHVHGLPVLLEHLTVASPDMDMQVV